VIDYIAIVDIAIDHIIIVSVAIGYIACYD